jgi:hypothetical protein
MKVILKKWKAGQCIEAKLYPSKQAAMEEKRKYLNSFTINQRVKEYRSATISKP